jgi:hypothetical protein
MPFTRTESRLVFHHLLDDVLEMGDSSPLKQALLAAGFQDLFGLLAIERATIDGLTYDRSEEETNVAVQIGDRSLLIALLSYLVHLQRQGTLNDAEDWVQISQDDFDQYRISSAYRPMFGNQAAPTSAATTSTPFAASVFSLPARYTPAELFRRGIKRDPSLFPVLKEEKFNDPWH